MSAARCPPRSEPANEPGLASHRDAAQRPFSGVVAHANSPVVHKPRESGPALQLIVESFGDRSVACEPGALFAHPCFETDDERRDVLLAIGQPFVSASPVDQALVREDDVDAFDRFERDRRWRQLLLQRQIGNLVIFAPRMRPAQRRQSLVPALGPRCRGHCIRHRRRLAGCRRVPRNAARGVRRGGRANKKNAAAGGSVPPNGLSSRTHVHMRPVIVLPLASTGTVVSSPCKRSPAKTCSWISIVSGGQRRGAAADVVGERRSRQIDAFTRIAVRLTVERLMLPIFLKQDHSASKLGPARPREIT